MRRPITAVPAAVAVLAALTVLVGGIAAAQPSVADAPVAEVQVQLGDPLMVDPVQLLVTATDAGGNAVPFTGVVTLTTGRTSTSASVTGDSSGAAEADLTTDALSGGDATAHASVTGGGGSATTTVARIVQVPVTLAIGAFGCGAIGPAGGDVRFAVTTMNGQPVPHPASVERWELAYANLANGPIRMVDGNGLPLATTGRVTIRSGTRTVATLKLPRAVRPMVFGVHWSGKVGGRFTPGTLTATLALTDARGRVVTATRSVVLVRSGTMPCLAAPQR